MSSTSRMMRLCMCITLAFTSSAHENGRNESIPNTLVEPESRCICASDNGQVINPTSLASTNGQPSLTVESPSSGYSYSYSPCRSFSLGPADRSNCRGDVSVCMWATNGASYQNIGRTSTERCGYEREFRTFRLEYKNPNYSRNWEVHVIFKCDPSMTGKPNFELLERKGNVRRFLLTHDCMCAGHCPLKDDFPTDPSPVKYAVIGAGSLACALVLLVLGACAYRRGRRPPPPANERPPPANDRQEDGDNNIDPRIENQAVISNSGQRPNNEHTPLLQEAIGVVRGHDNQINDSCIIEERKEENTRSNKNNNLPVTSFC
ncbi:uncharacterized protein [Montipora foliosa]|uniref:uncharacterized protein n=1 Tax=Montipora foliosa TaxID=591990 RepID=UPI0035F19D7D